MINGPLRKPHNKYNRACRVIQGRPYWCRQKSRTGCCCKVQRRRHFLKRTKIQQRENEIRRFQPPQAGFDDSSPRKAFEYLQIIYIVRN